MCRISKIVAVNLMVLIAGLACIELGLRLLAPLPVPGGVYRDAAGTVVRVSKDDVSLQRNLELTHTGPEFSASVSTNALGYRRSANESLTPDFLFLGDSFTFGHGVDDARVAASLFCAKTGASCLNLGRSGTDTFDQVMILRHAAAAHGIRPRAIVLVMLAACWIEAAGNDLGGNLAKLRVRQGFSDAGPGRSAVRVQTAAMLSGTLVKLAQSWLGGLELTKRAMLAWSFRLKKSLYACSDDGRIKDAIAATQAALRELRALAASLGATVSVVVIHPYQELAGAYAKTHNLLRAAMPQEFAFVGTGAQFSAADYFSYDGHFNATGHAKLADILARALNRP